jgi:AraC-like DNA-binding protein
LNPTEPLHRFRFIHSQNAEEFSHKLLATSGVRSIDIPSGSYDFSSTKNRADLDSLALFYCRHRSPLSVEVAEADVFHYVLCRTGQMNILTGQHDVPLRPGTSCIANSDTRLRLRFGGELEQFLLKIRGPALRDKLQALTDTRLTDDIRFDFEHRASTPEIQSLNRAINYLVNELDAGASVTSVAVRELEQLIVMLLLRAGHHNFSHLLESGERSVQPWQIRLTEEYIEDNWNRPITIELLAKVTGVSARSLFERFRSHRGYSPMAFVRQTRLKNAKKFLSAPDATTTVTGVALLCGFMNAGHFSRHYNNAFGELPSATLSRSRSLAQRPDPDPDGSDDDGVSR